MRITVTPEEFSNYIICFLLQSIVEKDNPDFLPIKNEEYQEIIEMMNSKAFKPMLLKKFMKLDHKIKDNYKVFKKSFEPGYTFPEIIRVLSTEDEEPLVKENTENKIKNIELLNEAIKVTTQMVTQKFQLNESKLNNLQKDVIEYLKNNGKL